MRHSSMIERILAILLILGLTALSPLPTHAQWPSFGVYHLAGTIRFISAKAGGTPQPLVEHTWLYHGDRLLLLDDIAEIILFDRDTNYIRLHGKGNYTVAQIEKMKRTHIQDNITVRYLDMIWDELIRPGTSAPLQKEKMAGSTGGVSRGLAFVFAPRNDYTTSMDSLIFRWHNVYWAKKYFLRLRSTDGDLRYDGVVADTQAVVHFPGHMPVGNSYAWTLDIVGESGRLQFADSGHINLLDESVVLPQLSPLAPDSIGGIAPVLQRIEQFENAGCIKRADEMFEQLLNAFPGDAALNKLYGAFRERNYF